jgi:hypothetical protein
MDVRPRRSKGVTGGLSVAGRSGSGSGGFDVEVDNGERGRGRGWGWGCDVDGSRKQRAKRREKRTGLGTRRMGERNGQIDGRTDERTDGRTSSTQTNPRETNESEKRERNVLDSNTAAKLKAIYDFCFCPRTAERPNDQTTRKKEKRKTISVLPPPPSRYQSGIPPRDVKKPQVGIVRRENGDGDGDGGAPRDR